MRRGVWLLVLGALAAALGAASAYADGSTTTATTTTTTTTTAPAPSYAPLTPSHLPAACVGAGEAAIAKPDGSMLALGTPASGLGPSAYPTTAPVVAFDSATAGGSTCKTASVRLDSVSLFGGAITATSVEATHGKGRVSGLQIDGSPVTLGAGESAFVGFWGEVTLAQTVGRVTAPLFVFLRKRHYSLPPGTMIVVAFSASAQPVAKPKASHAGSSATTTQNTETTPSTSTGKKKHRHHKHRVPKPLKRTPPLGFRPSHYVFPVDGGASYIDTYGANRNDIYDGWHHGDDLFAPLGTPVVAVANGKLSLVGWNRLGGWRIWLTDGEGNSFYYAHLAAYSRWILDHPNVRAGQVIGFLGRTGDAFTTAPHVHFEIHPQRYLKLGYDGAVDPTAYLKKWRIVRVPQKEMPNPAKLKAPVGTPAEEAAVVWHELLVARHLLPPHASAGFAEGSHNRALREPRMLEATGESPQRVADLEATGAHVSAPANMTAWLGGGVTGGVALVALSAGGFILLRRRRAAGETSS